MKFSNVLRFFILFYVTISFIGTGISVWAANGGFSSDQGTLAPYSPPVVVNGAGKKLLAIYMVGSDLESDGQAGTNDFVELINGYNSLTNKNAVEVIVAFGGANKTGWKGMKFATMQQIIADGQDSQFGNANNNGYLYVETRAHMGDDSSLKLFLDYVREKYVGFNQRFVTLWDHGASYQGFGNDENFNSDALSLQEIDNAFTASRTGKWDLIGFDACLMASLEVANIAKNHASYMLASEELEPGHGWNWSHVIQAWTTQATAVDAAKSMVENFVKNVHNYSSDGKTLSVVNLTNYENLRTKTDDVSKKLATVLQSMNEEQKSAVDSAVNVRAYGQQSKADARISIDLKHLALLIKAKTKDNTLKSQLDALIQAVDQYVVLSRHDGTRPDSYGVAVTAPENDSNETSAFLPGGYTTFQQWYKNLINGDQSAPVISNQNNNASSDEFEFVEDQFQGGEFNSADPAFFDWQNETLENINQQYEAGVLSDDEYNQLFDEILFANESHPDFQQWLNDLQSNIGNDGSDWALYDDTYPEWFDEWYGDDDFNGKVGVLSLIPHPTLPFLNGERAGLVAAGGAQSGQVKPQQVLPSVKGVSALFEDENLTTVYTLFGNILNFDADDDGNFDDWFTSIGSVKAFATTTEGEYFTPAWNKKWYFMDYDPNEDLAYIPMYFSHHVHYAGIEFTVYEAEVDYRDADVDYSSGIYETDFDGNPVEFATIEFTVAPNNVIVDHNIKTYRFFSNGPNEEDEYIQYDKKQRKLGVGDEIRFYAWYINLTREGQDAWFAESDVLTIAQEPTYLLDTLEFEDLEGNLLDYDYTMAAEDAAGYLTLTEPAAAVIDTSVHDWSIY